MAVNAVPVQLQGAVDNYASAVFDAEAFFGTLTQSGDDFSFDLGKILQNSAVPTIELRVYNSATGLADLLSGSFDISGDSAFMNAAFNPFMGLGAGDADTSPTVKINTSHTGTFSETITLHSTGSNASGYSGADETFTITGSVVALPMTMADVGYVSRGAVAIDASLLLANDSDPNGQNLSITNVGNATNGTVALSGQMITFTSPSTGTATSAGFDYTFSDDSFGSTAHVGLSLVTTTNNNDIKAISTTAGQFSYIDGMGANDRLTGGAGRAGRRRQ